MKTVRYRPDDPHVGEFQCPGCQTQTWAWRSSGMSASYPHFYCDRCSNAILRASDQDLLHAEADRAALLEQIAATLPACPCGGRFRPGTNPKCPHCGFEFTHSGDPVQRLTDPHVILIHGACLFGDPDWTPYQVRIE